MNPLPEGRGLLAREVKNGKFPFKFGANVTIKALESLGNIAKT
jgi:hypothetical protein